jgi:DNA-binding response OmpR family regulator
VVEVVKVRWPSEHGRRERLRLDQRPRLLLIEGGAAPPEAVDCLEDWIRIPADDVDLQARAENLVARCQRHLRQPVLDEGVLRVGDAWVSLTPLESRLSEVLLARMGTVASREALVHAGWPEGDQPRNTLDVHIVRLRRRLHTVGLALRTVRSRGYLLEVSGSRQQGVH